MKFLLLAVATMMFATLPALAASSDWYEVEGGRVRLVTSGLPDAAGVLRGILEIELQPGWKTYWRDPGDAGIPPQIEVRDSLNVSKVAIDFPPPDYFDDGVTHWAGYDHSLALPLTFTIPEPEAAIIVTADTLLGICESICIPVNARLELDPGSDPDNDDHRRIVEQGFAALPVQSHAGFRLTSVQVAGDHLTMEAETPEGEAMELFVASPDDWRLGSARRVESRDGRSIFKARILDRPPHGGGEFLYTLTAGDNAVDGRFLVP